MYHVNHSFDVIHWRVLQNAVTKVEDVTWSAVRAAQDIFNTFLDFRKRRKEQCRIEIALHRDILAENSPAVSVLKNVHGLRGGA